MTHISRSTKLGINARIDTIVTVHMHTMHAIMHATTSVAMSCVLYAANCDEKWLGAQVCSWLLA